MGIKLRGVKASRQETSVGWEISGASARYNEYEKMEIQPLHTKVDKSLQSSYGIIVLEHHSGFPRGESNLYCVDADGKIVWQAEKPDPYTLYSRVRFNDDGMTISTYTINGHACDLDPKTGKILSDTSIK